MTQYSSYEFLVMPFDLTNALATFCILMTKVLLPLLDWCVVVYVDDIVAYSRIFEEHIKHLKQVFQEQQENDLYVKREKCALHSLKCCSQATLLGVDKCAWIRPRSEPLRSGSHQPRRRNYGCSLASPITISGSSRAIWASRATNGHYEEGEVTGMDGLMSRGIWLFKVNDDWGTGAHATRSLQTIQGRD